ncbi:hypothetical protein BTA51_11115 [Hahella sp. CCB-MM4]|uniref:luciferase domain-containing protein n=1 Tax=Hahella sp. (strain CCB-MM4) TaxID=1926491 RepID=UPI000B9ABF99|nr:luciferase family protein [Hahella sp. CCB-MM4]OZG73547.1 hypothetical protein BTA51_11115 [Hahella sp. CCB-MM4]
MKEKLLDELMQIPGLEEKHWPGRDDGFSSLLYRGKEFAHFHDDFELDLKLTKTLIAREGLSHPENSRVHPNRSKNSQWIELPIVENSDVERIVQLVKMAIQKL